MEPSGDDRGQSEVIGVVLLLAIVVVGMTGIVVLGADAIGDTKQAATVSAAEHSMSQLDSKSSLVAHGDSTSQVVRLSGGDSAQHRVEPDRGWMNISIYNITDNSYERTLTNVSLGAVVYEDGDLTIAYQGGGVWQKDGDNSTMLSPPEFHYREETLTLPLVTVAGNGTLSDRAQITEGDGDEDVYPNATADRRNPLGENKRIVVEVHSEYYGAWGSFFKTRTNGNATVDHGDQTAIVRFETESGVNPIGAAVSSTAGNAELTLAGNGAYVDSYNSSEGPYASSLTDNGTLKSAGDVTLKGDSEVDGNIRSGGTVTLNKNSEVARAVEWTTGFDNGSNPNGNNGATYGSEKQINGIDAASDLSGFVEDRIDEIRDEPDNDGDAPTNISGNRLNFSSGTITLSAGSDTDFYLNKIDMNDTSDELVIDTNGNEVEIAVDGDMTVDGTNVGDVDLNVTGGGTVRFYVAGDITLEKGADVNVPGDRAAGLWLYGTPDTAFDMPGDSGNGVRFVGVLYATGDPDENVFDIRHANFSGGAVAGEMTVGQGSEIHYDDALRNETVLPSGVDASAVSYLHVSVSEVRVERP